MQNIAASIISDVLCVSHIGFSVYLIDYNIMHNYISCAIF